MNLPPALPRQDVGRPLAGVSRLWTRPARWSPSRRLSRQTRCPSPAVPVPRPPLPYLRMAPKRKGGDAALGTRHGRAVKRAVRRGAPHARGSVFPSVNRQKGPLIYNSTPVSPA